MNRSYKNKKILHFIGITFLVLLELAILFAVSIFPQLFVNRRIGDLYSRYIFPTISLIPTTISGFFYMSLTEMIVVVGGIAAFITLIVIIVKLVKNFIRHGAKSGIYLLLKLLRAGAAIAIVVAIVFQMMHGMNYRRTPPQYQLGLTGEEHTYEECCEALEWAYYGMVNARAELGSDFNGVSHLNTNFDICVRDANYLLDLFSDMYDLGLSNNYIRAKAVMLSRPWRYTGIIGVYDMFLGEANLNTDYMSSLDFPVTLCHELSHAKGYARETDCNIIADLACIHSARADFRYAGFVDIYSSIARTVYVYAKEFGYDLPECFGYPPEIRKDIDAMAKYDEYFTRDLFSKTVEEVSETVNDTFLEANGQEGGTETYIVPTDIYVDFYINYVRG